MAPCSWVHTVIQVPEFPSVGLSESLSKTQGGFVQRAKTASTTAKGNTPPTFAKACVTPRIVPTQDVAQLSHTQWNSSVCTSRRALPRFPGGWHFLGLSLVENPGFCKPHAHTRAHTHTHTHTRLNLVEHQGFCRPHAHTHTHTHTHTYTHRAKPCGAPRFL